MSSLAFFKQLLEQDPKAKSTAVTPFSYLIESKNRKFHFIREEHFEESSYQMSVRILKTNHPNLVEVFEKDYNENPDEFFKRITLKDA